MRHWFILIVIVFVVSCKEDKPGGTYTQDQEDRTVTVPVFDAQLTYEHIIKQLDFGNRVVGTEGSINCRNWLKDQLSQYSFSVSEQDFPVEGIPGIEDVTGVNIIAHHNPKVKERILLCAHYDTRHIADKDSTDVNKPISGADDGASGVAVILELARLIDQIDLPLGIDIVLFDAEDAGIDSDDSSEETLNSWGIGSQYWANQVNGTDYKPEYGILLDMVGAAGASFPQEGISLQTAKPKVEKIWDLANKMGYSTFFQNRQVRGFIDDHYFIVRNAQIPMIDIINIEADGTFGDYHHTHDDDLDIIDVNTLQAVGQVVIAALVNESNGVF